MAKKKDEASTYTGGHRSRQSRGMKTVVIPLTPEQHQLVSVAAALSPEHRQAVTRWAAAALEEVARRVIAEKKGKLP